MTLQDFINTAKYSELNTLNIKDDTSAIITFVNLGIIELYKRFVLKTEEYLVELQEGVTLYDMPSDYMYLIDAYGEVPENATYNSLSLPINEENNDLSINTINYNQIQIPLTVNGAYVSLIYASKPPIFTDSDLSAELPIPDQLITPLLDYIGYRGHAGIDSNMQEEGNVYYLRFEKSCDKVKELGVGIAPDDIEMPNRLFKKGYV